MGGDYIQLLTLHAALAVSVALKPTRPPPYHGSTCSMLKAEPEPLPNTPSTSYQHP